MRGGTLARPPGELVLARNELRSVDTDDPARRTYTATLRQVDGVWRVERVDAEGTPCAE